MKTTRFTAIFHLAGSLPVAGQSAPDPAGLVDAQPPGPASTHEDIHQHPELSHFEAHTSAFLAAEWRKAGYKVTKRVGKYPDGSQAHGIVGVLKNGPGPVVPPLTDLRKGMDGLRAQNRPQSVEFEGPQRDSGPADPDAIHCFVGPGRRTIASAGRTWPSMQWGW
jgi:hypothetical protein